MAGSWSRERLKRVADVAFSSVDKKTVEGEVAAKLCNYTDVYYNEEITVDLPFMEATATREQIRSFGLRAGDILITKDSETPDDIGVPAFVPDTLEGVVCGYHLAVLRPRPSQVNPRFLYWVLASQYVREQMAVLASGVTRYGLRFGDLGNLRMFLPSLPEQRTIADFLDRETARIDGLISRKTQLNSLLGQRHERVVATWVQRLLAAHGSVPLKRLASAIEQGWSPQGDTNVSAEEGEWGILKLSAVSTGSFRAEENKRLPVGVDPDRRWLVRDGDLLVVRGSGSKALVGRVCVAEPGSGRLLLPDLIYRVKLQTGDPGFLSHVLNSSPLRAIIESRVRTDAGQTLKIRADDLANLPVPAVKGTAQRSQFQDVMERLGPIFRAQERLETQLSLLREHRQAIVTQAVTHGEAS